MLYKIRQLKTRRLPVRHVKIEKLGFNYKRTVKIKKSVSAGVTRGSWIRAPFTLIGLLDSTKYASRGVRKRHSLDLLAARLACGAREYPSAQVFFCDKRIGAE